MRLAGKTAFISGGARGIGAETARRFAAEGARVTLTDILEDEGEAVAESHENINFAPLNVLDEAQWQSAIAAHQAAFGDLHILVNNAGITHDATPLEDTSLEQWRKVIALDLDAVFLGCKHAILAMKKNGGCIINVSSIYGIVGSANQAPYHAAKGGVRLLTKALAVELGAMQYDIRVNSIHPGFVKTELLRGGLQAAVDKGAMPSENEAMEMLAEATPSGRLGAPRDIADGMVFLASDEAKWMNGAELVIDGGFTIQ